MSNLRKSLLSSPGSSRQGSRVSSRSNSRAPMTRLLSSSTAADSDDEEDFSFYALDDLIASKLSDNAAEPSGKESSSQSVANSHSIADLLQSLTKSRTEVSSESREVILLRLYHLMISRPLSGHEDLVNEFDAENLIRHYQNARSENETLLLLKVVTTYCCGDMEEVGTVVTSTLLPLLFTQIKEIDSISPLIRANAMICYASLMLCVYDGSGAYGLDEQLIAILEIIEGLSMSTSLSAEVDMIVNGLHAVGIVLTLLYHGQQYLNDFIEDNIPRVIAFLSEDNLNIAKAAGRVVALLYELYEYNDEEELEEEDDYDEGFESSPYYDYEHLYSLINGLSSTSSKSINKKLKRELKSVFRDILLTLDLYSTKESREQLIKEPLTLTHLKLSKLRSLAIQSWYSFIRLIHLRYVFNAGLHDNLLLNSELNSMIKKPKLNDKLSKFDNSFNNNSELEKEELTLKFGMDYQRKVSSKKKDMAINNARAEKTREEFGDLALED